MDEKKTSKTGCCVAAMGLLVGAVLVVGALWHFDVIGDVHFVIGEEGVGVEHSTAMEREAAVITALREFAEAQEAFHAKFGNYAANPNALLAVDANLAGAMAVHPAVPASELPAPELLILHQGYYFTAPLKQGQGRVDHKSGYVIVAEPGVYEPGVPTFAIGPTKMALRKDMGGERITNLSQIDGSWRPVK